MYLELLKEYTALQDFDQISSQRKEVLKVFIDCIQQLINAKQEIKLHFICTHNSRRSQFAQIWATVAAYYYQIPYVNCFSGGLEVTNIYSKIIDTLLNQGFKVTKVTEGNNPVFAISYAENSTPVMGFSKLYTHSMNPKNDFVAVMTCSQANNDCPLVPGARKRLSITYNDPKLADHQLNQSLVYLQSSQDIAREMSYVFSKVNIDKS